MSLKTRRGGTLLSGNLFSTNSRYYVLIPEIGKTSSGDESVFFRNEMERRKSTGRPMWGAPEMNTKFLMFLLQTSL